MFFFFFSSRRRHTRLTCDWSSDVCSSDLAPSEVRTTVAGGTPLSITEETEYPFRGEVRLKLASERPVEFPLLLRIPAWAQRASVSVNGQAVEGVRAGQFVRVQRAWKAGDAVVLNLPM